MIAIPASSTIFLNYVNAMSEDEDNSCVNGGDCCNLNINGKEMPCDKLLNKLDGLYENIFPDDKAK
jgi:hypothetical protein